MSSSSGSCFLISSQIGWFITSSHLSLDRREEFLIIYSSDAGKTAEAEYARITPKKLNGIFFVENEKGWIVGEAGTIWHTNDTSIGRRFDWKEQQCPTKVSLYDVFFVNASTGWIVGQEGIILHTKDAGQLWETQQSSTSEGLLSVHFSDEKNGWILPSGSLDAYLSGEELTLSTLCTLDSGDTWNSQLCSLDELVTSVYSSNSQKALCIQGINGGVSFVNANIGWKTFEGDISITTDGGASWTVQLAYQKFGGGTNGFYRVFFVDHLHGWAMGRNYGSRDTLAHTTDSGKTWNLVWSLGNLSNKEERLKMLF